MSNMGIFELTHPELLSETELRRILKNSCIDFSKYEKLCRSELIEMYRKLAMPLPQRGEDEASLKSNEAEKDADVSGEVNSDTITSKSCNLKRGFTEVSKSFEASDPKRSKSPLNEVKDASKKVCSSGINSTSIHNGTDKRINSEKNEEAPMKKRQKITWP